MKSAIICIHYQYIIYFQSSIFFLTEEEQIGKPAPTDFRRASESETSVAEDSQVSCNNLPGCGTALCSELNMRSHKLIFNYLFP